MAANSFLATKISFINAMAEVCEAAGGDVAKLAEAIGHDDRIGRQVPATPGIGFGGGCLPKDIRAFMARAGELGADQALTFLREVDSINMRRRGAHGRAGPRGLRRRLFLGKRVAVLGAAFKPDSDDVRDSPALNVAGQIHLQGGQVTVYDPQGHGQRPAALPDPRVRDDRAGGRARGADVVLHLTEWREFRELDPAALGAVASQRRVIWTGATPWTRGVAGGRLDVPGDGAAASVRGDWLCASAFGLDFPRSPPATAGRRPGTACCCLCARRRAAWWPVSGAAGSGQPSRSASVAWEGPRWDWRLRGAFSLFTLSLGSPLGPQDRYGHTHAPGIRHHVSSAAVATCGLSVPHCEQLLDEAD